MAQNMNKISTMVATIALVSVFALPTASFAQYGGGGPIGLFGSFNSANGGQVLGAFIGPDDVIPAGCDIKFKQFKMRNGAGDASPDMIKDLQSFLNEYQSANLSVTGAYDAATISAVEKFQEKNTGTVLAPWNITQPTGNFYLTTKRYANIEYCRMHGFTIHLNMPLLVAWSLRSY